MIQDYTRTGNLEELLKILQNLFSSNKELLHLFIGILYILINIYVDQLMCDIIIPY